MKISKRHLLNYSILIPYLLLSILGLIVVYSTTSAILIEEGKSALQLVRNQGIFWIVSLILIALIYKLRLDFFEKWATNHFSYINRNASIVLGSFYWSFRKRGIRLDFGCRSNYSASWVLKIIIIWYLAHRFSKQQEEIATYDFQVLTQNQWLPRAFNDWRFVLLVLIGSLGIFLI